MPTASGIDVVVTDPKYAEHLEPIAEAIGAPITTLERRAPQLPEHRRLCLVASYRDQQAARLAGYRRFARIEHGVGQSYGADDTAARHNGYPGGSDADDVELFLMPNAQAAARWAGAYPRARVVIVGSPRPKRLRQVAAGRDIKQIHNSGVVVVSFHWDCRTCPETRSALDEYRDQVVQLARHREVLGHGHPWLFEKADLAAWYERAGIRVARTFDQVVREAALYVCDNSSTMYEASALGIPVATLNSARYRRDRHHGLRFWDAIPGLQCDRPRALRAVVTAALEDPPEAVAARAYAVSQAFAEVDHPTEAAAEALREWAAGV